MCSELTFAKIHVGAALPPLAHSCRSSRLEFYKAASVTSVPPGKMTFDDVQDPAFDLKVTARFNHVPFALRIAEPVFYRELLCGVCAQTDLRHQIPQHKKLILKKNHSCSCVLPTIIPAALCFKRHLGKAGWPGIRHTLWSDTPSKRRCRQRKSATFSVRAKSESQFTAHIDLFLCLDDGKILRVHQRYWPRGTTQWHTAFFENRFFISF